MTTEKMPDVIWADVDIVLKSIGDWSSTKSECYETKYLRAEPVRELLKSIRDQVEFCKKHDSTPALDKTMELIDNFLGG